MRWWWGDPLCTRPTRLVVFLAHWNNNLRVDMSPHLNILTWFWANQSLLLLLNAAYLDEKHVIISRRFDSQSTICKLFLTYQDSGILQIWVTHLHPVLSGHCASKHAALRSKSKNSQLKWWKALITQVVVNPTTIWSQPQSFFFFDLLSPFMLVTIWS